APPEGRGSARADGDRLRDLVEAGAWLQITVDSLLGNHGPEPRAAAEAYLAEYPAAVLATDAHRPGRCSGLSAGDQLAGERFGPARAEDLRGRADHILRHLLAVQGVKG